MLDVLTKEDGGRGDDGFGIDEPRFPKTLPDVARASTMDGRLAVTAYIYINKVALADLESLEFDGKFLYAVHTKSLTGFQQGAHSTIRRGWRTLEGAEVHDGLIIFRGER
jgi:hypothetical protein